MPAKVCALANRSTMTTLTSEPAVQPVKWLIVVAVCTAIAIATGTRAVATESPATRKKLTIPGVTQAIETAEKGKEQRPAQESAETATPTPAVNSSLAATLTALHLRSRTSDVPATIRFTNESPSAVTGYWIDFDGNPERYFDLESGKSTVQSTYQNHIWVLVDDRGVPLKTYVASAGDQSVTLSPAGFDCSRASSSTEKRICADPALATMDGEMATLFQQVIQKGKDLKAWNADQHAWLVERDRCKDDDGCLRDKYLERLVILRAPAPPAQWAGSWWRADYTGFYGAGVDITQATAHGFHFHIGASDGANVGDLEGGATLTGPDRAHWRSTDKDLSKCILNFERVLNRLKIGGRTDDISCGAGMGVDFSGTYIAGDNNPNPEPDLVAQGVVQTPEQDDALRKLLGKDYDTMAQTAERLSNDDNRDGNGATVVSMFERGLGCISESVLMSDDKGHLWAAVWDAPSNPDDPVELRYYTNVSKDKNTLPKTISAARDACGDTVKVRMMP